MLDFHEYERTGTYLFVCVMQLLCKIFETVLCGTLAGKILKMFVCEIIFCQSGVEDDIT